MMSSRILGYNLNPRKRESHLLNRGGNQIANQFSARFLSEGSDKAVGDATLK